MRDDERLRDLAVRVCDAGAGVRWDAIATDDPAVGVLRDAIAELTGLLDLAKELPDRVTVDLLFEATGTFDGWYRALLLAKLVPHLGAARLREVVALLPGLPASPRLSLIPTLADHLDADQREAVVRSMMALPASARDGVVVTRLLPYLTPAQRDVAIADAVRQLSDASDVKNALSTLAPHLTGAELATAMTNVRRAAAPGQYVAALTWIARHLTREQRTEALNLALQLEDGNAVAYDLGKLAPHLDSEQLDRAVAAADGLPHAGHRARALTGLIPHLPDDRRTETIQAALTAVLTAGATDSISNIALPDLVPHLSPEQLQTVLDMVCSHRYVWGDAGWQLGVLAPYLSRAQLAQAIETARAVERPSNRCRALVSLVAHLGADGRRSVVDLAIDALRTDPGWVGADARLVAAMTPSQRDTLFDIAAGRPDHANIVAALAAHLRPDQRDRALAAALDATENDRVTIIVALAPHLDRRSAGTALSALAGLRDPAKRADALLRLAVESPTEAPVAAAMASRAARDIIDAEERATILTKLVDLVLPAERSAVAARAYAAAMAVDDENTRYQRMCAVIPVCLPPADHRPGRG